MQFRKIAALAGSALMAGMTLAGAAMAANVANVGQLTNMVSVTDHTVSFPLFVVGADASSADVAGAIDVAVRLAGEAATTKTIATTTSGAAADGVTFRTEIGNTTGITKDLGTLGSSGMTLLPEARGGRTASFLNDGTITVGSTEYKYYEKIGMPKADNVGSTATDNYYLTRGTTGTGDYTTQYNDIGFTVPGNDLYYELRFETAIPYGTGNLTGKTIKFLGKDFVVTYSAANEIKLSASGAETTIAQGSTATVGGYTVEVKYVGRQGTNTVADVKVTDASGNSDEQIVQVGGTVYFTLGSESVPVYVKNAIEGYSATVLLGSTSYDLKGGQPLKTGSDWVVDIGTSGAAYTYIKLKYQPTHSAFTGEHPVLMSGDSITAPENFFVLKNVGPETRDYYKITVQPTLRDLNADSSTTEYGLLINVADATTGNAAKVIGGLTDPILGSSIFADQIAWDATNGKWRYVNSTGYWTEVDGTPTIQLTENSVTFALKNATDNGAYVAGNGIFYINEPTLMADGTAKSWKLEFDYDTSQALFGDIATTVGDATDTYLSYQNTSVAVGGTNAKARVGYVSDFGTKVDSASTSGVTLEIPKSQMYYDLVLGRESGSTTGTTYKEVVPIKTDVVKLDTEVTDADKSNYDMVVVGGPAVNRLAAELMGKTYPAYGADSGIPENAALVKVFQDAFATGKAAVLIAGWSASDTDLACNAIQQDKLVGQTATAAKITGTVTSPVIEEYTE